MKALICYFSGTGNTKMIAERFSAELISLGTETVFHNIEKPFEGINIDDFDTVGFAYPIYAFNAPKIVLDFAKALSKREKTTRTFILKTSGESLRLNDASSCKLKKILKKRGFLVTNEYHYIMPYNIIFRHTDEMAKAMWAAAQCAIPYDAKEVVEYKSSLTKPIFMQAPILAVMRIQQWGGRFNGKRYKMRESCIGCNRCVKVCPVGNIQNVDGKLKFGKNCLMCMRCAFECPKDAIKIGLFEKWKVNGKYSFDGGEPVVPERIGVDKKHRNFCRKSYERYFADCRRKRDEMNGTRTE